VKRMSFLREIAGGCSPDWPIPHTWSDAHNDGNRLPVDQGDATANEIGRRLII
jgi:hypothetical protein